MAARLIIAYLLLGTALGVSYTAGRLSCPDPAPPTTRAPVGPVGGTIWSVGHGTAVTR